MRFVRIPRPILIVVDDVGWWCGRDGSRHNEPYRTGFPRDHVPADYAALVNLGRALGTRVQAAFVAGEWDFKHRLASLPSATWLGPAWGNPCHACRARAEEAADIIHHGQRHLEIACHGLAHEYWGASGAMERAEWYGKDGVARPDSQAHLELFHAILHDNNLPERLESFVPCAFHFRALDDSPHAIAQHLSASGYRFMSTPFANMHDRHRVDPPDAVFYVDHDLVNIDRGFVDIGWDQCNTTPDGPISGPVCGIHWPAILHADPRRNDEAVEKWVDWGLRQIKEDHRFFVQSVEELLSQEIMRRTVLMHESDQGIEISVRDNKLRSFGIPMTLVLHSSRALALMETPTARLQPRSVPSQAGMYTLHLKTNADKIFIPFADTM